MKGMAAEHIRNPVEWGVDQLKAGGEAVARTNQALHRPAEAPLPEVRRIGLADLNDALARGLDDFGAYRTDVIFIALIYPIAGLVLARMLFGYLLVPLLFPLAAGFALLGPVAAVGLYEMSRRREQGLPVSWKDAFGVLQAPAFGAIAVLGLLLLLIFLIWMAVAEGIYLVTLGPEPPVSFTGFVEDVFTTAAGWTMIVVGMGVGFLFAVLVLAISVVSFPLLLDRPVGLTAAVATSVRAVLENPVTMALWGLIVAGSLVLGSLPALLGLIFVLPILGHATWHLYRKIVV
jgi:uncharacterized membrane protein